MEQLTLRDREPRTSQTFINLSANIRLRMRQYSSEVQQLKIKVEEASKQRNMYPLVKLSKQEVLNIQNESLFLR